MWFVGIVVVANELKGKILVGGDRVGLSITKVTGNTAVVPVLGSAAFFLCLPAIRDAMDLSEGGLVDGKENGLIVLTVPEREVSQEFGVPSAGVLLLSCSGDGLL